MFCGDVVMWPQYLIEWLAFWSSGTRKAQSGHSVSSGLSTGSVDPCHLFPHVVSLVCQLQWRNVTERGKEEKLQKSEGGQKLKMGFSPIGSVVVPHCQFSKGSTWEEAVVL